MSFDTALSALDISTQYRTGESEPVEGFYRPCLLNSKEYKRAVGYFRSSVFLVVGPATIEFARRGGYMRLVCSPCISDEDAESIGVGYEERIGRLVGEEIDGLLAEKSTSYRTRVLATLVACGSLDVRVALRPKAYGLYHEKIGIFCDERGGRVSFLGSGNETWNGWHFQGNHEALEVFRSWAGVAEAERVERHDAYFERLWAGAVHGVDTMDFPEAARRRLVEASLGDPCDIDPSALDPRPAEGRNPLPHQSGAIAAWKAAGRRGVFEHATGSGKTFTAIMAMREHLSAGLPVLVLVPSRLLLNQWAGEIRAEIPEAALLLAGAGNERWRQPGRLRSMTDQDPGHGPRIVLATMQTAAGDDFLRSFRGGPHLMIVVDEVHQSGSAFNSRAYTIETGPRLGLSATPNRHGDGEGTARMFGYFGPVVPPPVTLRDAIKAGRLVEYEYHPHPVRLTANEAEEWKVLTLRIVREMWGVREEGGPSALTDRAKMLLIQRARIAKKALMKIPLAAEVVASSYKSGQRWLVYCEDGEHLRETMEALRTRGLNPIEYHSAMGGDRSATLDWFRMFGGVLVSIKCLDEGVDIPAVDHAMILASSQNPRQFIQRRGRVLRKADGKSLAVIHDAIVVPVSLQDEPEQIALLRSEFARAVEFAESAINRGAAAELRALAGQMGFDPVRAGNEGIEEEERGEE
ncbi:DEAD/DEAH box helicase family protein [Accumulibacter sp.]|uniref:DEAD/DEAH box helicase family protein n=1 Tax=Accumulibacter sp. TaxID=2053492 RepID=UPI00263496B2|nr:DEAD/DEAH box helicase family protein [Accumulibacter sp.]